MTKIPALLSIRACRPLVPTSAAAELTLKSPRSVVLLVQADKLPDSKPSAKIRSAGSVGVFVGVAVSVNVEDGVRVSVGVGVSVRVDVGDSVGVLVGVSVGVSVTVGVNVGVLVGVFVGVSVNVDVDVRVAVGVGVAGKDCASYAPISQRKLMAVLKGRAWPR